jgi:hypothetical protein
MCTVTLAVCTMLVRAQDNDKSHKKVEGKSAPATQQHAAPQQHQQQQHTATPQEHTVQRPEHHETPTRTPNASTAQPAHNPPAQTHQQTPTGTQGQSQGSSTGRTFGTGGQNRPAGTSGRTIDVPQGHQQQQAPAQAHPGGRTFGNQGNGAGSGRVVNDRPVSGSNMSRPPMHTVTTPHGDVIQRAPNGQVREVHMSNGAVVYHPPNGPRRVEVVRPGNRVIVASAPGHGYVQRPVIIHNTTIIKRTYIYNGVPMARIYRPRIYNGISLVVYTPVRYYRPAFYVWAFNPWPRPVVFTWGWSRSPWYGYYGGYFTPYPTYVSPSLWLTDYLIAATLESAYQERMAANSMAMNNYASPSQPMSPETKQAIADEVRRQIDQQRMEQSTMSSGGPQPNSTIFSDNQPHVFVANASYMYNSNAGECAISEGDVIQMRGAPPMNSPTASLVVLSSRGQDCPKGATISAPLQDLQEMNNAMMATVDRGLSDMQSKQGQNGMPSLPQGSAGTIDSPYVSEAQPDANVAGELNGAIQETDHAEQQAISQAPPVTNSPAGNPPTLVRGLSIDEVKAIQGQPDKIVDLGTKKIYVYKDLKITFIAGKVTDIQ